MEGGVGGGARRGVPPTRSTGDMCCSTYFVVLRPLPRMGRAAEADAAPGAYGGRAGLRRLCRPHHGGDRRGDRGDTPRRNLCRGARLYAPGTKSLTEVAGLAGCAGGKIRPQEDLFVEP